MHIKEQCSLHTITLTLADWMKDLLKNFSNPYSFLPWKQKLMKKMKEKWTRTHHKPLLHKDSSTYMYIHYTHSIMTKFSFLLIAPGAMSRKNLLISRQPSFSAVSLLTTIESSSKYVCKIWYKISKNTLQNKLGPLQIYSYNVQVYTCTLFASTWYQVVW